MQSGVLVVELFLPAASSLKERRQRLRRVVEKLRQRFNVAVAEVDGQNSWQRAVLAVATVAGEEWRLELVLDQILRFLEGCPEVMVSGHRMELHPLGHREDSFFPRAKAGLNHLILVTGGVRSGKSRFAESLLREEPEVFYLATAVITDAEMEERIKAHRSRRPHHWHTLEEPEELVRALEQVPSDRALLLDCLGIWVSNLLVAGRGEKEIEQQARELVAALRQREGRTVVVTNEVGMGLVPTSALGRIYRDLLGNINQILAQAADMVYLVVCGLPMQIKP
ncbi:Adenosylcobinamide-phosphate guanylyltransferase [Ammonifex degensii KC4]|uniref:Adenosylcobinamide kinase n=1 Tax=Ammonifex degensii (strain DSM 10501 / KC4) TaxID=429009 RepID=C9R917_AMMDK|nr:bifunctional adenosylcobinamide kinase/adenosylcobinamide-phosphate guanylyltransferase [Ammonifex degensii]ACX52796.1 Adenosylcobinamide-phosphate guanylyltransferase [Ammonifex degensii KC4]